MKYFGTDGIRGIAGEGLNKKTLNKIARALITFYNRHNFRRVLLIANDTRISSDWILANIVVHLLEHGIEVHNLGIATSPCVAYLTKKYHYPMSIMISASHNSHEYNGIKFFNSRGEKLSTTYEYELESYMDKRIKNRKSFAKLKSVEKLKNDYINYLSRLKRHDYPCIFDCASGSASEIIRQIFPQHIAINSTPSGYNINHNAGCTHIESLCLECRKSKVVGFAFDGDADRVIMVDEYGNVINGDKILYILSKYYLQKGDMLIGTIYSNEGLKESLSKNKITLVRAGVGDRNVYDEMKKTGSILGGENSGHIILKHYTNTGDGILNAIILLNILFTTKLTISELLASYEEYHHETLNLKLNNLSQIDTDTLIKKFSTFDTRIVIRPSGTEPLLRIMVECQDKNKAKLIIEKIKEYIII